ncbi:MAG: hypothetical protein H7843_09060 [Nitrospirota bacterium]
MTTEQIVSLALIGGVFVWGALELIDPMAKPTKPKTQYTDGVVTWELFIHAANIYVHGALAGTGCDLSVSDQSKDKHVFLFQAEENLP